MSDVLIHVFAVEVLGIGGHLALAATSPAWDQVEYMHWGPLLPDANLTQTMDGWRITPLGLPMDRRDIIGPWRAQDGSYLALKNRYVGTLTTIPVTFEDWEALKIWSLELQASHFDYDPMGWRGANSNGAVHHVLEAHFDITPDSLDFSNIERPAFFGIIVPFDRWFPGWNVPVPAPHIHCEVPKPKTELEKWLPELDSNQ